MREKVRDIIGDAGNAAVTIHSAGNVYTGVASAPGAGKIITLTESGGTVWTIDASQVTAIGVAP